MNIGNVIIDHIDQNSLLKHTNDHSQNGSVAESNVPARDPSMNEIVESVNRLNESVSQLNERISFSYNDKANRVVVKVINSDTNETIREIPPKDIVRLAEHIQDYLGILVDESR